MSDEDFKRIVEQAFAPFLTRLGFKLAPFVIEGRCDRATFLREDYVIDIYYEPGDEVVLVFVFLRENGIRSEVDDQSKTLRLSDLKERYMPMVTLQERADARLSLQQIQVSDEVQRHLVRSAEDLCLVLPKYLSVR